MLVPFARVDDWPRTVAWLRAGHVVTLALTPDADATDVSCLPDRVYAQRRMAVLVGNEAGGLAAETKAACDLKVRIPMANGEDSVNAATAAAIALHTLTHARRVTLGTEANA